MSLPLRRVYARRALVRAHRQLREACRGWEWAEPRAWARRQVARGTLLGHEVEVGVGPDPRSEEASQSLQAVWVRVRILSGVRGHGIPPILLQPYRAATVQGPADWAAIWLGVGFEAMARPSDQLEVDAASVCFDRFDVEPGVSIRELVESVMRLLTRVLEHGSDAGDWLSKLAREHGDPGVRHRCLTARVQKGDGGAIAAARSALRDSDRAVRLVAATTLGDRETLRDLVHARWDEDHRMASLSALAAIDPSAAEATADALLRSPSPRLARHAMKIAAVPRVADLVLRSHRPPGHRASALEALEARDPESALTTARVALSDVTPAVRSAAADILGRLGDRSDLVGLRRAGAGAPAGLEEFVSIRAALELIRYRTRGERGRLSVALGPDARRGEVSLGRSET